ncbi:MULTISPECIES: branched-chain amino acid ABC transporter permease [Alcaligenaceae]|uniref:branched-chain amino acid ABC transporter permease n=1 Tax=Alcaligenaceae TaxID=506 RepID=UPI002AFF6B64|nr:branched-chain amino acid ABC transporter permease [Castellaniella sp.]
MDKALPVSTMRYVVIIILALLLALPLLANDYQLFVASTMLVYCLVAVGLNTVLGYLGQLAFASAAFFGIGAYAAGLSMVHLGFGSLSAILVATVCGGLAGILVGLPALRVRGYYLAIITLAFGELMRWFYVHGDAITYGSGGFNMPDVSLFGFALSDMKKYYLFLFMVVIGVGASALLLHSRYGRAFVAVRNNEPAAGSLGIAVNRTKIIAFAWSGLITGLAGALYAILNGRVSPDTFGISQMLMHFVIVMIGGLGSLAGSMIGAVLLTGLPELLRNFPGLEEIVFSALLIVVLFFMPKGVGGFLAAHLPWMRERLYREGRRNA